MVVDGKRKDKLPNMTKKLSESTDLVESYSYQFFEIGSVVVENEPPKVGEIFRSVGSPVGNSRVP